MQLLPAKNDPSTKIIYEGVVSKFVTQNCKLTNRFLILNPLGLFVYKDHLASKSFPTKPMIVIPLNEISSVQKKTVPKKYVALES